MPRRRRAGEKLPPSGKMSSASSSPRVAASAAISPSVSPPRGSTKRLGSRWPRMSNSGSRRSASCSTTRGRRRWRTKQLVQDKQRVALAGMAAEHDERPAPRGERPLGGGRVRRAHVDARQPGHRAMDARHEPAHEAVVRAHHARRSDVAPEAAGHPQPTAGGRAGQMTNRVVGGDRHHARRARVLRPTATRSRRSGPAAAT